MYDRHTRASEEDVTLRKLRLECCLLFFRYCAHTHNAVMCMAQSVNVGRDIQRAFESIVKQQELFQIDEVAKLLGQFSCKNQNVSKHTTHVCWGIRLALKLVAARIEVIQFDKVAKLLGQFSCKQK